MRKSVILCLLALGFLLTAACGARQVSSTRAPVPPKAEPALTAPTPAPAAVAEMRLIAVPDEPAPAHEADPVELAPAAEADAGRKAHMEERIEEADRDIRNAERILARKSAYRPKADGGKLANALTADDFKVDRSGFERLRREFASWYEDLLVQFRAFEPRGPEPRVAHAATSTRTFVAEEEALAVIEIEADESERDEAMLGLVSVTPPPAAGLSPPPAASEGTFERVADTYLLGIVLASIGGIVLGILLSRRKSSWMLVTEMQSGRPVRSFEVDAVLTPAPRELPSVTESMEADWYESFEEAVRADDPGPVPEPEPPLPPDIVSGVTETTQRPPPQDSEEAYPKVIFEA